MSLAFLSRCFVPQFCFLSGLLLAWYSLSLCGLLESREIPSQLYDGKRQLGRHRYNDTVGGCQHSDGVEEFDQQVWSLVEYI